MVYVVCGARLYGKTDEVPGVFFVATKFCHLYYIPWVPGQSYLVLKNEDPCSRTFAGVQIGTSCKSILLAYLRTLAFFASIITFLNAIGTSDLWHWMYFLFAALLAQYAYCDESVTRANYERACELVNQLQPSVRPLVQCQLDIYFGRGTPPAVDEENISTTATEDEGGDTESTPLVAAKVMEERVSETPHSNLENKDTSSLPTAVPVDV